MMRSFSCRFAIERKLNCFEDIWGLYHLCSERRRGRQGNSFLSTKFHWCISSRWCNLGLILPVIYFYVRASALDINIWWNLLGVTVRVCGFECRILGEGHAELWSKDQCGWWGGRMLIFLELVRLWREGIIWREKSHVEGESNPNIGEPVSLFAMILWMSVQRG